MSFLQEVSDAFRALWLTIKQTLFGTKKQKNSWNSTIIILLVVGVGMGGLYGYRWYIARRESQAQKTFGEAIQLFEQAKQNPKQWDDVSGALEIGYKQHSGSKLAPFFLLFRADALSEQEKGAQAITVMEDGLKIMSSSNPLHPAYSVKLALMKMDSDDKLVRLAGLEELEKFAKQENEGTDMASYYLGLHFWGKGETEKAREIWKQLVQMPAGEGRSAYALLADEKLKQIS